MFSKLSLLNVGTYVRWSGPTPMCVVATQLSLELELYFIDPHSQHEPNYN